MVIKNKTLFQKEYVEAAMHAANFDDNKYKFFKIVYNMFGLLFGMGCVRYLVFLYIGMVGMDKSNKRRYHNTYSKMIGITFTYEIDSEDIIVTDEENDSDTFKWDEVIKWAEDKDNIYLFVSAHNCLVINKDGFTEGTAKDLKELAAAVFAVRGEDDEQ